MPNETKKIKHPKHPIMQTHCANEDELVNVMSQALEQRKQFAVNPDDDTGGWTVSYTSGPAYKAK